jgi:tetratricopeptide (TPR) repeat protein
VVDPQNLEAMSWLAGALMFNGRIEEAMAVTRRQLALNPNHVHANRDLAAEFHFSGRWEDALRQVEVAIRLNPLDRRNLASSHSMAAKALVALQRYDEALARARLILDGPGKGGHGIIASAEAWRGDLDAAQAQVAEVRKRSPELTIARLRAQRGSTEPAYLAGMDHYFEGLRRAGLPEGTTPPAR